METITLVKDAIHRPDEPRHFMQFKFPDTHYVAQYDDKTLASTRNALVLMEVAYAIYEPVIYFPLEDVSQDLLQKIDKTTHCPLKGDTAYFDLEGAQHENEKEIAWSYAKPLPFAAKLREYLAFDPRKIRVSIAD